MIENIIKLDDEKVMGKLKEDIEINLPKYKEAFYAFYKENNETFPFENHSFKEELLLVIFLNEYNYSHEIVIKVLDELLIPLLNMIEKILVLNFLFGFDIITKEELNTRNDISKIISSV